MKIRRRSKRGVKWIQAGCRSACLVRISTATTTTMTAASTPTKALTRIEDLDAADGARPEHREHDEPAEERHRIALRDPRDERKHRALEIAGATI